MKNNYGHGKRHNPCSEGYSGALAGAGLYAGGDGYPLAGSGDAIGQAEVPLPFALVHAQQDAGGGRRGTQGDTQKPEGGEKRPILCESYVTPM